MNAFNVATKRTHLWGIMSRSLLWTLAIQHRWKKSWMTFSKGCTDELATIASSYFIVEVSFLELRGSLKRLSVKTKRVSTWMTLTGATEPISSRQLNQFWMLLSAEQNWFSCLDETGPEDTEEESSGWSIWGLNTGLEVYFLRILLPFITLWIPFPSLSPKSPPFHHTFFSLPPESLGYAAIRRQLSNFQRT